MDKRTDIDAWGATSTGEFITVQNDELPLWNNERNGVTTTLRYGSEAERLRIEGNWTLLRSKHDGYIGWAHQLVAGDIHTQSARMVQVRSTHLYPMPDIKSPPLKALPLGAQLCVYEIVGEFARTDEGYVYASHLSERPLKPSEWARQLLGTPYLWGGGTANGIDCSGLSQLVYSMVGERLPRDTDQQEQALTEVSVEERQEGDLIFWPGHVAIMASDDQIIHATAYQMSTIEEDYQTAIARIGAPSSIRRVR